MSLALTEAGPSRAATDTSGDDSSLQSFRQIYYALEAANSSVASKALLHVRLKQILPRLRTCCDTIPPSSSAAAAKLDQGNVKTFSGKQINLDRPLQEVVKQCAAFHNVDETEMAVAMRCYLDSDEASLQRMTKSASKTSSSSSTYGKSSERQRRKSQARSHVNRPAGIGESLVDALSVFYFDEKLYALRCVNALLRIGDDSFHELHTIAEEILRQFIDQAFSAKCLERMEALCNETLTANVRENPRYSTYWAGYSLRMQLALLEVVFLIFYSRLDATAAFVESVHKIAQRTEFGRRQVNAGFFDTDASSLLDCLSHLLVLLCIESLDVERLIDGMDLFSPPSAHSDKHQLIDQPDAVGVVVDFLRTSTVRDNLRGPLLIAWALFVSRIDSATTDWNNARPTEPLPERLKALNIALDGRGGASGLWTEFVSAALIPELDLFATLNDIAKSPLISWHAASRATVALALSSSLAMRAVLKGLLLSITELVRPEYLQDYDGLVQLWQRTFTNEDIDHRALGQASDSAAALCAQFWQVDYEHEQRRSLLVSATRRFPVSFSPMIKLCRALSGSGPGALHTSDEALSASSAVLNYLATMQTITHIIPTSTSLSAPYQLVATGDSTAPVYRATRDIPVFGRHLIVPAGTMGRIISAENQSPIIMVWHLSDEDEDFDESGEKQTYSAWRLMRDILAQFAGLLDRRDEFTRTANESGDASVFFDKMPLASFAALAPDEGAASDGDAAAEMMDLLSSILATESKLSTALLAHLDSNDEEQSSVSQPVSHDAKLVTITLAILNQALAVPGSASRVIISAYRLLTLALTASRFEDIWLPLRTTGLLVGAYGLSSYTSHSGAAWSSKATTLLEHETSIGKYAGLLSLLDFHHALLADVQQSAYALSLADADVKVDVVLRALRFIVDKVWLSFLDWKYVRLQERIEIGRRCVQIFSRILLDDSLARSSPATARLRTIMHDLFVTDSATPLILNPVLNVLSSGQASISRLQQGARLFEIESAREQLEACLRFARTIVDCRRRSAARSTGLIERAFLGGEGFVRASARGKHLEQGVELASTVMSSAFSSLLTVTCKAEAVRLITSVCNALSDNAHSTAMPALISHLGSMSDVETLFKDLLSIADDAGEDVDLRVHTLNMLASLIKSQPGIATLLLTGKHVASVASRPAEDVSTSSKSIERTALDVIVALVQGAKDIVGLQGNVDHLRIVEASLKFLQIAWEYAAEHRTDFDNHRRSKPFWTTLMDIGSVLVKAPNTEPSEIDVSQDHCRTDCDAEIMRFALIKSCSALALHLIAIDIRIAPSFETDKASRASIWPSLASIVDIVKDESRLLPIMQNALLVQCDPLRHIDVAERINQSFPEFDLEDFRLPARLDEFDLQKQFGCAYVYGIGAFHYKLQGLLRASQNEDMMLDAGAVTQATLLVAGVNLDWSAIDVQSTYLRAWTSLVSVAIGPLFDRMQEDKVLRRDVRRTLSHVWLQCAESVANEDVATVIVRDIHTLRVALLANLLESAWCLPRVQSNKQLQHDYEREDTETTLHVIQQAVRLTSHPLLPIEDSMRQAPLETRESVHRDASRIVLVCSTRYRALRTSLRQSKSAGDAEILRNLQRCAERFVGHTIACLRIAIDRCAAIQSLRQQQYGKGKGVLADSALETSVTSAEVDLQLLTSTLATLLHQDSGLSAFAWLSKMHTTNVLESALDLFSRSHLNTTTDGLSSGAAPMYWESLLPFFLDLACQPSTGEALIVAGVMNAFMTNAISAQLDSLLQDAPDRAHLTPRMSNGSATENALYGQWIKILRVVMALVCTLEPLQRHSFVQREVASFYKVFHPIVQASLSRKLMEAVMTKKTPTSFGGRHRMHRHAAATGGDAGDAVMLDQLEELDLVAGLCMHVTRARLAQDMSKDEVFLSSFVHHATMRLQEFVHLLQHPHELAAFMGMPDDDSKRRNSVAGTDIATRHLVQASMNIIETFWTLSNGFDVLCSTDASQWSLDDVLIVPTIGTSPNRPASTGTLLDFAAFVSDALRDVQSGTAAKDDDVKAALHAALEQAIALAAVQLAMCMHGTTTAKPVSAGVHNHDRGKDASLAQIAHIHTIDVEAGLGRDVVQATESALHKQKAAVSDASRSALLQVVLTFQRRWLVSSE